MKKPILVLVMLVLLLSAFVVADETDPDNNSDTDLDVDDDDTDVGKNLIKEAKVKSNTVNKAVSRLHLTGSGLAISEDDVFDFMNAKVVVGAVKVRATEDDNTDSDFAVKRLGVLMLDNSKYHLKNIAVSTDTISAEIFGPTTTSNADSDSIGELEVTRFEKPGKAVWAGNMVLDGKAYNVYFLGMGRNFKLTEVTEKIGDYCEENPDDSRCKNIVPNCAAYSVRGQCSELVSNYCQGNTSDLNCLRIKKQYCLKNASDERCLEYLKDLCEEKPSLAHCRVRTVEGKRIIGVNPTAVAAVTAEKGESITSLVIDLNRSGLRVARKSVKVVNPTGKTNGQD